jgi:maleate cis-trans isomerase
MAANRRLVVGVINPTRGQDSLGELEGLLPKGVELVRDSLDIREQTEDEFKSVLDETAMRVDALAAQKVDLIHPIGAPVFMVHGYAGEQRIIDEWTAKHGIPIFTSGQSHVNAMRALGIHRFVALSPLSERINEIATAYYRDAGFDVLAFERARGPETDRRAITWEEAAAQARRMFEANPGAEGVYFISSGWRILDAVPALEKELGVPVVHPVTARVWEMQRRLGLKEPTSGVGRLLEELPTG